MSNKISTLMAQAFENGFKLSMGNTCATADRVLYLHGNAIAKFDIGQSIIVQNGNVIGIEAAQGTDILLKESKKFITKKNNSVLVKLCKKKQDLRVDLPTIGIRTVQNCKKSNINGIAFSSGKTIFINKSTIIDYCIRNNLFLLGI